MGLRLSYSLADQEFIHTKSLGVWNVSTQLLGHLAQHPAADEITLFSNRTQTQLAGLTPKVRPEQHNSAIGGRWGRICWDQWSVYSAARRSGQPWLFLPKGFASFYRRPPVRLAAFVHDAMHDYYRTTFTNNPLDREAAYFLRCLRATLQHAEVIFTNTDFTRSEVFRLAQKWSLPAPHVLTAGIGFDLFKPRLNGNGPRQRIVVLAGPWPHKCTARAVQWMQRWSATCGNPAGVDWIGAMPPDVELPALPGWKHHQRLSQQRYEQVLGEAAVLVYFSAYEGFGMPPVEGTLAGAAAVYSAIPAMLEVMDGCGYAFANNSFEQFASAMDRARRTSPGQLAGWQHRLGTRHAWPAVADRIVGEMCALEERAHAPGRRQVSPAPSSAQPATTKLLVFAHTPPPHHGQSYMVKLMLDGFGGNQCSSPAPQPSAHGIACHHVNARFSNQLEDIGDFSFQKATRLIRYCARAIGYRFRYGVNTLYYVPAPGKPSALLRDWLVMALCRPFYKNLILHWHAAGLSDWLNQGNRFSFWLTRRLLGRADLSIVISEFNQRDAAALNPRRIVVVSNGIPDPCPDFATQVLPRRNARLVTRRALLAGRPPAPGDDGGDAQVFKVLYLAHATREKGVFDTITGCRQAVARLRAAQSPVRLQLTLAGDFLHPGERAEFDQLLAQPDIAAFTRYVGFITGAQKLAALREADVFCFPTFYENENQPVNLIEAMAWGLPILTTRWRSVPGLLPDGYPGIVPPQDPGAIGTALVALAEFEGHGRLRDNFCRNFTLDVHLASLAAAFRTVGQSFDSP